MKFVVLLAAACLVAVEAAPPQAIPEPQHTTVIPIISHQEIRDMTNQYTYTYTTGNGISARSRGRLVPNSDNTGNVLIIDGETTYTSPEGTLITLKYTSDEKGFHPVGDHLPVA